MTELLPSLSKGEEQDLLIRQLSQHIELHFLELGGLLCEFYDGSLWLGLNYDRWADYVESLGIGSYNYVMSLISIARMVAVQIVTPDELAEIGYSKACLLAPLAKKDKLSREIIELAKCCTNRDLRLEIGYKVPDNESDCRIICSRCGNEIYGAKWVSKNLDVKTP
jgi:hypothetical protein